MTLRKKPKSLGKALPLSAADRVPGAASDGESLDELIELGHVALMAGPGVTPSDGLRTRLLSNLDPQVPLAGYLDRLSEMFDLPRQAMADVLAHLTRPNDPEWQRDPALPIRSLCFHTGRQRAGDGVRARLVVATAGGQIPDHGHTMDEWTLVLRGGYTDTDGEAWLPGDLHPGPAGTHHGMQVHDHTDCIVAILELPPGTTL